MTLVARLNGGSLIEIVERLRGSNTDINALTGDRSAGDEGSGSAILRGLGRRGDRNGGDRRLALDLVENDGSAPVNFRELINISHCLQIDPEKTLR
jgi:hypothetical protein